jgi:hypothetical protein
VRIPNKEEPPESQLPASLLLLDFRAKFEAAQREKLNF